MKKNFLKILDEARLKKVDIEKAVKDKRSPRELFSQYITPDHLAYSLVKLALDGDKDLLKLIAEYILGKPVQKTENLNVDIIPKGIEIRFVDNKLDNIELIKTKEVKNIEIDKRRIKDGRE